jgi:D-glucosaminate-6-phosphate ammonia-lyase
MKNEVIMVRSQRNFYDHAIRAAGASIIEVGLPDRHAGAGVRDAEPWEIEDAINANTAAIFYVAGAQSVPSLREVARLAKRHRIPVIVDAAAQLPPQSNLQRFTAEGADLVAFSGGKALGGPQASGILAGRRDLVMSAALQHLDLDIYGDMWNPPKSLIDKRKLKGTPQHGIGRSCKAGKEEIVGLLTALRRFIAEGDAARHRRWLGVLQPVRNARLGNCTVTVEGAGDIASVPQLTITLTGKKAAAAKIISALVTETPPVHVDPSRRDRNQIVINPMCLTLFDAGIIARRLASLMKA